MAEFDPVKEQIAYFKLWLGILLAADISLIGWVVSTEQRASPFLRVVAVMVALNLGLAVMLLHRRIQRLIDRTGKLRSWKRSARY